MPLQGMASYGEEGVEKLGAIPLNGLKFKEGMLGVAFSNERVDFGFLNPGPDDATVEFTAYGPDGTVIATETKTIEAGKNLIGSVDRLFSGVTLSADDYVGIESNVDLYGFEMIYVDGRIEMLPVLK